MLRRGRGGVFGGTGYAPLGTHLLGCQPCKVGFLSLSLSLDEVKEKLFTLT